MDRQINKDRLQITRTTHAQIGEIERQTKGYNDKERQIQWTNDNRQTIDRQRTQRDRYITRGSQREINR